MHDVVIVGAGTAGCVLANRLSEDANCRVLLIEAGPKDTHPFIHMPRGIGKILADPNHVWPFPVHSAPGTNEKPAIWLRGRTLGGSSSVNGLMYVRGQPADFDALAAATSQDWGWNEIGPIYRRAETHPLGAAETRGDRGPLHVSLPARHPLMDLLLESGAALGLRHDADVNRPDGAAKIGYCPSTIWRGRRQSASIAFLRPVRGRRNLEVVTGTTADRLVISGRRATGIECIVDGERRLFEGRRIILASGTFGSPAILQRSGIGPGALLRALGIEVVADRPEVGANMTEHCALALQWRLKKQLSLNLQFSGWRLLLNGARYYLTRGGPMAGASYDVLALFKSHPEAERADAQLIAAPYSIDKTRTDLRMEALPGMQIALYPLRPRSTGNLRISSRDAEALPAAALDCFSDEGDRRTMVGAVRFARSLMAQRPIADLVEAETRPGPTIESDDQIIDAYRALGTPAYHAAGTCRMGSDDASVVDPLTRVRGVEGVHVVDLSIAPVIPAGNTFAPVMAMAWRAADLIRALDRTAPAPVS